MSAPAGLDLEAMLARAAEIEGTWRIDGLSREVASDVRTLVAAVRTYRGALETLQGWAGNYSSTHSPLCENDIKGVLRDADTDVAADVAAVVAQGKG